MNMIHQASPATPTPIQMKTRFITDMPGALWGGHFLRDLRRLASSSQPYMTATRGMAMLIVVPMIKPKAPPICIKMSTPSRNPMGMPKKGNYILDYPKARRLFGEWPAGVFRAPSITVQDFRVVDLPSAVSARVDALFVDDRTRWGGSKKDLGNLFSCRIYSRRVGTNRAA